MPSDRTLLEKCQAALTANGFDVFLAKDPAQVRQVFFEEIFPGVKADLVSWGDSMKVVLVEGAWGL